MKNEPDIRIVVLQRSWVLVGLYERDGFYGSLVRGAVVRRYGTQGDGRGLGYLAAMGPTPETHLEPCTLPVEFHELTTITTFRCDAKVWAPVLEGLRHE